MLSHSFIENWIKVDGKVGSVCVYLSNMEALMAAAETGGRAAVSQASLERAQPAHAFLRHPTIVLVATPGLCFKGAGGP